MGYLNKMTNSLLGTFPQDDSLVCSTPCHALCGDINSCKRCGGGGEQPHGMPGRVLLMLLFPGHIIFVFIIFFLKWQSYPSGLFLASYLLAAFIQVSILLCLCRILVYWMWSRGTDPDNAAIPYLTAVGDLVGTSLLALSFLFLESIGDESMPNEHHGEMVANVTESALSQINSTLTTLMTGEHHE